MSDSWRITGGTPLRGRVSPSGSKNGALPSLAAALLLDGETVFHNVPRIADTATMLELLQALGLRVDERGGGTVAITNSGISTHRPPGELVAKMRASHYVLAPLLARLGKAELPETGGCNLGARPLGYVIDALAPLGVECQHCNDRVEASTAGLVGGRVVLDPKFRSPGATFSVLMAAATARGTTTLENACFEPDVIHFCRLAFRRRRANRRRGYGHDHDQRRFLPARRLPHHQLRPPRRGHLLAGSRRHPRRPGG